MPTQITHQRFKDVSETFLKIFGDVAGLSFTDVVWPSKCLIPQPINVSAVALQRGNMVFWRFLTGVFVANMLLRRLELQCGSVARTLHKCLIMTWQQHYCSVEKTSYYDLAATSLLCWENVLLWHGSNLTTLFIPLRYSGKYGWILIQKLLVS